VHAPGTLISGVHKVRPGHVVFIDAEGHTTEAAYWRPPEVSQDPSPLAAVESLDGALTASVRSALVADVAVGAYLSGGIDSSLLIALCRALEPDLALHTYSAGFLGATIDEIPWADSVARDLGTTHHVVRVGPEDFMNHWPDLSRHRDAPLSEPADIAVYLLARRAREDVRVVLSGEGSDELFAGYPKYLWATRITHGQRAVPPALREFVARSAAHVDASPRIHTVLRAWSARTPVERRAAWFAPFSESERIALLHDDAPHGPPTRQQSGSATGEAREMLLADFVGWLPDNLLERGDRMSMAASIELRPPFLDPRVIDLALRLPDSLKVRAGQTKWLVRQVALRYLSPAIVHRPKAGFPVPLDTWFRGHLTEFAHDLLLSPTAYVQEALDRRMIEGLLTAHTSGRASAAMRLWTLLSLEVWHRSVMAGPTSSPAAPAVRS
jgi:asparagine synthase (glutamine-hydrolysing)